MLADADGLASCYGVGEVFRPESLSTIVELGFTSSIRFLQPGLLLHGRPAPHSQSSYDEPGAVRLPGTALVTGLWAGLAQGLSRIVGSADGSGGQQAQVQQRLAAAAGGGGGGGDAWLATGSPASTRAASPSNQQLLQQQQAQPQQQQHHGGHAGSSSSSAAGPAQQSWLWRQQRQPQLPRSSYRHRKEIEEAGQLEVRARGT